MPKGQKIDADALKRRRLEARRLLDEGCSQAEVARKLKTSRQSVSRWAQMPRGELERVRPQGRKSSLGEKERAKLKALLLSGPEAAGLTCELWTVPRVRQVMAAEFGHRFSNVHVWRLLRQIGFSPQRPEGRARERDEEKIAGWKTREWPRIKKKRSGKSAP